MRKQAALFMLSVVSLMFISSCTSNHLYEKYLTVPGYEWKYQDTKPFPVEIKEDGGLYNIYISLRHTEEYPFSNIWVQMHIKKPGNQEETQRFGLTLAADDGRWFGTRLGSVYDIPPFLVLRNYAIPKKGLYNFILQHAMRQDEVPGIMDVGIRVEKAE